MLRGELKHRDFEPPYATANIPYKEDNYVDIPPTFQEFYMSLPSKYRECGILKIRHYIEVTPPTLLDEIRSDNALTKNEREDREDREFFKDQSPPIKGSYEDIFNNATNHNLTSMSNDTVEDQNGVMISIIKPLEGQYSSEAITYIPFETVIEKTNTGLILKQGEDIVSTKIGYIPIAPDIFSKTIHVSYMTTFEYNSTQNTVPFGKGGSNKQTKKRNQKKRNQKRRKSMKK